MYLFKLDIADGFYRVWVHPDDMAKLAVMFPHEAGEEPVLAFPLALPMGWVESPPCFCAVTETITYLANQRLRTGDLTSQINHRLDSDADTYTDDAPEPQWWTQEPDLPASPPLAQIDIYVNDFIGVAQGSHPFLERVRRTLFETVDEVLHPLEETDACANREEPISVKKLRKGDGAWNTTKVILGWKLNTLTLTTELTPSKFACLHQILDIPTTQKRAGLQKWQQHSGSSGT
jgi:hypothetical protein